jgi:hypothetical protein
VVDAAHVPRAWIDNFEEFADLLSDWREVVGEADRRGWGLIGLPLGSPRFVGAASYRQSGPATSPHSSNRLAIPGAAFGEGTGMDGVVDTRA